MAKNESVPLEKQKNRKESEKNAQYFWEMGHKKIIWSFFPAAEWVCGPGIRHENSSFYDFFLSRTKFSGQFLVLSIRIRLCASIIIQKNNSFFLEIL